MSLVSSETLMKQCFRWALLLTATLTIMTIFLDCDLQCQSDKGKAVCGSDGKTYKNKCLLNCKAKKDKKKVTIRKQGPCDKQPPKGK